MVSKNQIKLITSLQQKKYRKLEGLFIAEGKKVINELLQANYKLVQLFVLNENLFHVDKNKTHVVSEVELKKISALTTANDCLALFEIPQENEIDTNGLVVALDDIRDPGNLGTIIRLCDWFGITELICSHETVDVYNPKVVQATMGSLARVNVNYINLDEFLLNYQESVFGTFMDGENIYTQKFPNKGLIVLGNEANGISEKIEKLVTQKIAIPRFGSIKQTESLNVATATAIILSEFKRQENFSEKQNL